MGKQKLKITAWARCKTELKSVRHGDLLVGFHITEYVLYEIGCLFRFESSVPYVCVREPEMWPFQMKATQMYFQLVLFVFRYIFKWTRVF